MTIRELVHQHTIFEDRAIDKEESLLSTSSDFFFANVYPFANLEKDEVEALKASGAIARFEYILDGKYRLYPNPTNYGAFPLPQQYHFAFKEVVSFLSRELEKDNYQLMEQMGAEISIDVMDSSFDEIRAMLSQLHLVEPVLTIIDGEYVQG